MTNVPQDVREMWADIYRLFDAHYNMPNTALAWTEFWEKAESIRQKYTNPHTGVLILVVSEMIEYHMTGKMMHPCSLEDTAKF